DLMCEAGRVRSRPVFLGGKTRRDRSPSSSTPPPRPCHFATAVADRPTGVASAFQLLIALAVVAAALLDPFPTAIGIARLVGVVLTGGSVHPALPRRFARIFRGDGRWEHGISGRLWCRCGGGSRRAGGRSGGGRIGAALGFAEIAPILPVESARGFGRLVL